MGKYKNNFVVEGSKILIEAFSKHLDSLDGFRRDLDGDGTAIEVFGWNGYSTARSVYRISTKGVYALGMERFQLPEQWNEAVKFASELAEPEFKMGQWLDWYNNYETGKKQLYRICSVTPERIGIEWWSATDGRKDSTTFTIDDARSRAVLATEIQIAEYMKVIANFLFPHDEYFTSVRPYVKGEVEKRFTLAKSQAVKEGRRGSSLEYIKDTDTLYSLGYGIHVLYEKGIWATKRVEYKLPEISEYIGTVKGNILTYGCKSFHIPHVLDMINKIEYFNTQHASKVTSIEIDGKRISIKELEQISKGISSSK